MLLLPSYCSAYFSCAIISPSSLDSFAIATLTILDLFCSTQTFQRADPAGSFVYASKNTVISYSQACFSVKHSELGPPKHRLLGTVLLANASLSNLLTLFKEK